jgi:hypothetical protein
MSDMTPEEALKMIEKVRGPDGIAALQTALKTAIEQRKLNIAHIQGEMTGLVTAQRMLTALEAQLGFSGMTTPAPAATKTDTPPVQTPPPSEPDPELVRRLKEGICTFRDRRPPHGTGKWCERKLKTKPEQSCGYCKIHMAEAGIATE